MSQPSVSRRHKSADTLVRLTTVWRALLEAARAAATGRGPRSRTFVPFHFPAPLTNMRFRQHAGRQPPRTFVVNLQLEYGRSWPISQDRTDLPIKIRMRLQQ